MRGEGFEIDIYSQLSALLTSGALGLDTATTKVFRQKPYYSDARKANVRVDVSIELFLPGAQEPFLVWVFECKDHSRKVSVGDIEAFDSMLQQIGANNTKGTVISREGFQKSAIAFAKARHIGLVRLSGGK